MSHFREFGFIFLEMKKVQKGIKELFLKRSLLGHNEDGIKMSLDEADIFVSERLDAIHFERFVAQ